MFIYSSTWDQYSRFTFKAYQKELSMGLFYMGHVEISSGSIY